VSEARCERSIQSPSGSRATNIRAVALSVKADLVLPERPRRRRVVETDIYAGGLRPHGALEGCNSGRR
jgi:hypothetical protein